MPRRTARSGSPASCCQACRTSTATPSSAPWPGSPSALAPGEATFWTWRQVMYRFLERIGPQRIEAIAAQLYVEMLEGGLHGGRRVPLPAPPARRTPLRRPGRARRERDRSPRQQASGIGLTHAAGALHARAASAAQPPKPRPAPLPARAGGASARLLDALRPASRTTRDLRARHRAAFAARGARRADAASRWR